MILMPTLFSKSNDICCNINIGPTSSSLTLSFVDSILGVSDCIDIIVILQPNYLTLSQHFTSPHYFTRKTDFERNHHGNAAMTPVVDEYFYIA